MNFSTVKAIVIPEGSVKQITDSNGVVLWKQPAPEPEWHTIWQGSQTITYSSSGTVTGAVTNFAQSVTGLGTTPTIRITFTLSPTSSGSSYPYYYFYNNGVKVNTAPSSPMTLTIGSSILVGVGRGPTTTDIYSNLKEVYLSRSNDTTNNRITFNLDSDKRNTTPSGTISLTITKIEQYY